MAERENFTVPSSDGHSRLFGTLWKPEGQPSMVLQIAHGCWNIWAAMTNLRPGWQIMESWWLVMTILAMAGLRRIPASLAFLL